MGMAEDVVKRRGLDTGYSWVVMMANFGACFVCGGILQTTGIMHMSFLEKYKQNVARTAWIASLFICLNSLACPLGSMLLDRTSCRVTVVVGALIMAIGCLITAFSPNIDVCLIAFGGLTGTGAGITYTVLFVVIGLNFRKRLNFAQGVSLSGAGFGLFVMAPVMEAIKEAYGYTSFFLFVSGLCLQLVVMGTLMRPSVLEIELKLKRLEKSTMKEKFESTDRMKTMESYLHLLKNKCVWCLSFSMFMYFGGIYCMFIYWPNLCTANGLSPMQGSVVLSVTGVTAIIGRVLTGVVASLPVVQEYMVLVGSFAIVAISLILSPFYAASFVGNVVIAIIIGLCYGCCYVVISAINVQCVGVRNLSAAIGLEFLIGGVGSIVVPVISGYLIKEGWSYAHIFVVCGVCMALGALLGLAPRIFKSDVTEDYNCPRQEVVVTAEKSPLTTGVEFNTEQEKHPFTLNHTHTT